MNWHTVKEVKLVWAPIGTVTTKKGEQKTRFLRIGVRVTMQDDSYWFYSLKHDSWTKHWTPVRKMDTLGRPMTEAGKPVFLPERTDRYTTPQLHKEWMGRKPELVLALETAVANAEEE
jgi:hypothetical protein